jgi:hypothetical protein
MDVAQRIATSLAELGKSSASMFCHFKANMNRRQQRSAASFAARSKPWSSKATRPEPKGSHNAQRNYDR